jgi:8-oxo-dGTP diphosphatase
VQLWWMLGSHSRRWLTEYLRGSIKQYELVELSLATVRLDHPCGIISSMERRVNVRGIVVDENGRVFAVKHRDRNTGGESDYWAIPGGGLDVGESMEDGLMREFEEELGVKPVLGRLLFMQQFIFTHRNGKQSEKMELFFHVMNTMDFQYGIDLSATSHGHELARVNFIDPASSDLLPDFLQKIDLRHHIDTSQPALFVNNLKELSR